MTFDLDMWPASLSCPCLDQVQKSGSWAKVHGYRMKLDSMRWFSHRWRTGGRHNCISCLLTWAEDDSPNIHRTQGPQNAPWQPRNGPIHWCCTLFAACAYHLYAPRGCWHLSKCIFVPGYLYLWPLTTFELGQDFCALRLTAKFHYPTFNRSKAIMFTKKLTNKQTGAAENIHLAMLMGKQWSFFGYGCTLWVDVSVLKWSVCDLEWGLCCFNCYYYYIWIQSAKLQEILWSI